MQAGEKKLIGFRKTSRRWQLKKKTGIADFLAWCLRDMQKESAKPAWRQAGLRETSNEAPAVSKNNWQSQNGSLIA